jgi:hypothetical protein
LGLNYGLIQTKLDDINKNTITKLENKLTGIEEPIVEIYEVDTVRKINDTKHDILNPSLYIYSPFDGLIYAKGEYEKILVEFEATFDKRIELGRKFSPSRTGKEKGMLSLSPNLVKTRGSQVSTVSRRVLERQGSIIYINQEPKDSIRVVVETRYQDSEGNYIDYETLENNLEYASIQSSLSNKDIYLNSVKIGRLNSSGHAIVPILGYARHSIHSSFIVTGSEKIPISITNSGIVSGILRVKIYDIESETILATEDFIVNKQLQKILVANPENRSIYIAPNINSVVLQNVVNLDNLRIMKLRDSYASNVTPISISSVELFGDYNIIVKFTIQSEAVLVFCDTIPFRIVSASGGGTYGI